MAVSLAGTGRVAVQSFTSLTECRIGLPYLTGAFLFRPDALALEEDEV